MRTLTLAVLLALGGTALVLYAVFHGRPQVNHESAATAAQDEIVTTGAPGSPKSGAVPDGVPPVPVDQDDLVRVDASSSQKKETPQALPIQNDLQKLQTCFNADTPCAGFATSSYHDYQVDVLTHMQAVVEGEYLMILQDPSKKTPAHEQFGRELLGNQQPELQLMGIKFLDMYGPNQENLEALSNCLSHTLNEELFEVGMKLVREKYKGNAAYDQEVRDMLARQIQYGIDETTSHRAAQELYQYLDYQSFNRFSELDQKIRAFRERHAALNSVLTEYAAAHHYEM